MNYWSVCRRVSSGEWLLVPVKYLLGVEKRRAYARRFFVLAAVPVLATVPARTLLET